MKMTLRTIAEITVCLGFAVYFLWSTGKIFELAQRVVMREKLIDQQRVSNAELLQRFENLNSQTKFIHDQMETNFTAMRQRIAAMRTPQQVTN
jgi:cell division protein FtsL